MHKKRMLFILGGLLALILLARVWDMADNYHHSAWRETYIQAMQNDISANDGMKTGIGYHIHINLDELTLYIFKDGILLKTYPVSGGKTNTPSPIGNWRVISKDTWGEGFGGAWMGFNVPWGLYGIHGTIEPWSVGRSNSSEGCIRMKNADAKELYKLVPYGTTVTIVYESIPLRIMRHGDVGSDVVEAEKKLKSLGYYNGSLDGVFGDALENCVKRFQKENKLRVTGKINSSTYNLIMELSDIL